MSLLSKTTVVVKPTTKLDGENIVKVTLKIGDLLDLDQHNKIGKYYDIQRNDCWSSNKKKELITSILEGIDIPKFYFATEDAKIIDGIKKDMSHEQRGRIILANIYEDTDDECMKLIDGLQRSTTIFQYASSNEFQTAAGVECVGRYVGRLLFSELPSDVQEVILNYEIDMTIYCGSKEQAIEYFHRLNSGTPLNAAELSNAYNTPICNWTRQKANINSSNDSKFKAFITDDTGIMKLRNKKAGKRMTNDKVMKQAAAYTAIRHNILDASNVGKDALEKLSKSNWQDLEAVPVINFPGKKFNLQLEIEKNFQWIDTILASPRKNTVVSDSLLLNLYMFISEIRMKASENNQDVVLEDPIQFSKVFFNAHFEMYMKDSVDYDRTYEEFTRRGVSCTIKNNELKTRVEKLVAKIGDKPLGIEYSK